VKHKDIGWRMRDLLSPGTTYFFCATCETNIPLTKGDDECPNTNPTGKLKVEVYFAELGE
jgi:hypothetical protein